MSGKREALIDAAKALLWERGYEAMSPKAVLRESGAGQGSLYHHFEGKRDLAAVALKEVAVQYSANLDKTLDPKLSALKRLEAYLDAPRLALRGCRFGRLSSEQAITDPVLNPIVSTYFKHLEDRIADTVREAQESGDLPKAAKAKDIAMCLIAIVQGGYVLARTHQDPDSMAQAIAGAKTMLNSLTAQSPNHT